MPSVLLGGTSQQRRLLNPAQFRAFAIPPLAADGTPGHLNVGLTHAGAITATGRVEATYRAAWF